MRYRHPFTGLEGLAASSFAPSGGFSTPVPAPVTQTVTASPTQTVTAPPPSFNIARQGMSPDQFQYSEDQILQMLERGQSETVERSGESDAGLPVADDLELTSRQSDATRAFLLDAENAATPTLEPAAAPAIVPLAILGALFYFM